MLRITINMVMLSAAAAVLARHGAPERPTYALCALLFAAATGAVMTHFVTKELTESRKKRNWFPVRLEYELKRPLGIEKLESFHGNIVRKIFPYSRDAEEIKLLRRGLGITVREAADIYKIPIVAVTALEHGHYDFNVEGARMLLLRFVENKMKQPDLDIDKMMEGLNPSELVAEIATIAEKALQEATEVDVDTALQEVVPQGPEWPSGSRDYEVHTRDTEPNHERFARDGRYD